MSKIVVNNREVARRIVLPFATRIERDFLALKFREMRDAARGNFRNRTGRLYGSIKLTRVSVSIGSRRAHYWRFIDNFTRGTGEFVRQVFSFSANARTLRQVFRRYRNISLKR